MTDFDRNMTDMPHEELMESCRRIKHVALDMDGTIYLGSKLFPFTKSFLASLSANGIRYSFLTNNPTRSIADYIRKLHKLGIEATPDEVYTTAVATIDYIHQNHPEAKRLFVLGTPSMIEEFEQAGFEMADDDPSDRPDLLVVAFDMTLTYDRLCRAAWWASQGLPYIATNPDRVCPTDQDVVLVDCGSMCECIFHATGRRPDIVIGKPNPDMLRCIMTKYGLRPDEVAMCGDRIYTDVATARNAGSLGVLVLSGETTLGTAMESDPRPAITAENIAEFGRLLLESRGIKH
ncbi:MAG: HAD-IIA family hydrolase [Muribaculaceae bacterium]|nr:HAD-IIA family hydrolase [Muribaculaceae bacterium]